MKGVDRADGDNVSAVRSMGGGRLDDEAVAIRLAVCPLCFKVEYQAMNEPLGTFILLF